MADRREVLVTGASRGIGRATAIRLARDGARLHLVSRSEKALAAFAGELPGDGHRYLAADLAEPAGVESLLTDVAARMPRVDVVVVNAGIAISASIEETSLEDWDRVFALNVRSPFLLLRGLIPALRESRGRVVVVGSVVSTEPYPLQGAYAASKHALYGLTRVLARELHEDGVVVQTVLPGGVATDMVRRMRPDIDTSDLIQPEDVAEAIAGLIDMSGAALTDEIRLRRRGKTPWA